MRPADDNTARLGERYLVMSTNWTRRFTRAASSGTPDEHAGSYAPRRWVVVSMRRVGVAALVLVSVTSCTTTSHRNAAGTISQKVVFGSGGSALAISPPTPGRPPSTSEAAAHQLIDRTIKDSALLHPASLELFGYGNVSTNATEWGAVTNLPAWVAGYRVPFGSILPASCPGRATPLPEPKYGDVVVLVNASDGAIAVWTSPRAQHCR